jgi:predicted component of type VI protein secretion system
VSKLTVLNPMGYPPQVAARGLAPSLPALEGKKLFLVDVGFENSDNFMRQLHDWLAQHEPRIEAEVVRWRNQHEPDPTLCERITAEGDAAILGVGL